MPDGWIVQEREWFGVACWTSSRTWWRLGLGEMMVQTLLIEDAYGVMVAGRWRDDNQSEQRVKASSSLCVVCCVFALRLEDGCPHSLIDCVSSYHVILN